MCLASIPMVGLVDFSILEGHCLENYPVDNSACQNSPCTAPPQLLFLLQFGVNNSHLHGFLHKNHNAMVELDN